MPNLRTLGNPFWVKSKESRMEKKKERTNAVKSGHYILPGIAKGSARTSLGPIVKG